MAKHFGLNTSNLRYWEREFKQLHPKKNSSGKRKYSKDDVAVIGTINHLVKERGFAIEGAEALKDEGKSAVAKVEALENWAMSNPNYKRSYNAGQLTLANT